MKPEAQTASLVQAKPGTSAFAAPAPGFAFGSVPWSFSRISVSSSGQVKPTASSSAPTLRRKCACENSGQPCAACSAEQEKTKTLRRQPANAAAPSTAPPIVHEVLRSPGQPLDASTRSFMEPRFGHDFSRVRVHTDARASESARAVNALAYTVGSKIVFGTQQYSPVTAKGKELLAHELTHVVAQGSQPHHDSGSSLTIGPEHDEHEREAEQMGRQIAANAHDATSPQISRVSGIGAQRLQRQPAALENIQLASGGYVGDIAGADDNVREDVLTVMDRLHFLWAITNADYSAEYPVVGALPAHSAVPKATIPKTIHALKQAKDPTLSVPVANAVFGLPVMDEVGAGKPNHRADILQLQDRLSALKSMASMDYAVEHTVVAGNPSPGVADASIPKTIQGITKAKQDFTAGEIRRDVLAGTTAVTPTQHAEVEQVLNPGTTLVPAAPPPPPPVGGPAAPPPPPVVHPPPALSGGGPGGDLEVKMLDYLKRNMGGWATQFNTLKASPGQPSFPIASAGGIATAAQGEVEHYFGPYIKTAGRGAADKYHPGTYSLIAQLGDESIRPLTASDRRLWLRTYFETLRAPDCFVTPCAQEVLDAHHYLASRDSAELDRITTVYLSTPANVKDTDDTIHSWPGESATGTVFIQPYQQPGNAPQKRKQRWDLFTTLIHEMMHLATHPNFITAADTIGGSGQKILKEGFAEVMRTELWSGPGQLRARIANAEMAPLRQQVEGAALPYDASAVIDHSYYSQLAEANQIDAKVGRQNSKAAFFLGQIELLGLGAGTSTEGGASLAGVAAFSATDSKDAEIVVAQAGDNYASIQDRTGAAPGGLKDEATGSALAVGAAIAAGTRVKVPGIRWVAAVKDNTLGTVAEQNHISVSALAKANQLPPGSPDTTPLIPPKRILIPIHLNLP